MFHQALHDCIAYPECRSTAAGTLAATDTGCQFNKLHVMAASTENHRLSKMCL